MSTKIKIIKGIQYSSATAAAIIGILLAATIIQIKIHDPIVGNNNNFATVFQLIERNPSDQNLREELRALDMLARKAYFTSLHQLNTGTVLFFIALAIFLLSWNIRAAVSPPLPAVPQKKFSWWEQQAASAKTAAITSAVIVAIAVSYGIYSKIAPMLALSVKRGTVQEDKRLAQWWTNFRGPGGIGIAANANAPINFNGETMTGIRWKVRTPLEGFSSPVVYDNRIYVTGGSSDSRQVYCFDAEDGRLIWTYDVNVAGPGLEVPKVDKETGYAAPSVAVDGRQVYAIFATGELIALTLNGRHVWSKFLGVPDNHYGHSSSLMVHDGLLFVQFDEYDTGKLFAFNARNGRVVWEVPRTVLSWSSPININTGTRRELIVKDNENVTSYDPATGRLLWSIDCMHGEVGPTPAFANGKILVANEYAVAAAIDVVNLDAEGKAGVLWQRRGDLPNTASPVAIDSLLFLATATGIVTCIDTRTGERLWFHMFDRGFYSSPIISGDNVLLFDRNGVMHVFKAAPEFSLVTSSPIGEPVTTTPAILNGFMIVRGDRYLYRVDGI